MVVLAATKATEAAWLAAAAHNRLTHTIQGSRGASLVNTTAPQIMHPTPACSLQKLRAVIMNTPVHLGARP